LTVSETVDLGPLDRIPPGEGRTFALRGRRIAVFRTRAGAVYATQASCPHRGGPLADGLVGERSVVCPLHGFQFDLATGASIGQSCDDVATYAVSVGDDGRIHLHLTTRQEAS
jgi:nitrite reductase (NADH) small subunit